MENSLDLVMVWALYGTYMCKTFWPRPVMPTNSPAMAAELRPLRWPKKAHMVPFPRPVGSVRPGSLAGLVPRSNKDVFLCFPTLKVHVKPFSHRESICFRPAESCLIVCDLSSSMLLQSEA